MIDQERRERGHLARADRDVADGERHVAEQEERVARLRECDEDATLAEDLLRTFQATLDQHRTHRASILDRLARLRAEPA